MSQEVLNLAKALAIVAHKDQVRKGSGEPYINHVSRIVGGTSTWRSETIAWLHDVVEDCEISRETLLEIGIPEDIVDSVVYFLTRSPEYTYNEYIDHIVEKADLDTLYVKLYDLEDNLRDVMTIPGGDWMKSRYTKAHAKIWERIAELMEEKRQKIVG